MKSILVLSRPTEGDKDYYKRWEKVAPIDIGVTSNPHNVFCIVTDQYTPITIDEIALYPNLKYVVSATTGETHLSNYYLMHAGIKVLTLKDETEFLSSITSVAEHTLWLLLELTKRRLRPPMKLAGKKAGVIGIGRVGKQVIKSLNGLGMNVRGFDKGMDYRYLEHLFEDCDVITIHLSENEETRNMINRGLLNRMKRDAIFLNTSRASIVDNSHLYYLVVDGRIRGAGLDVVDEDRFPHNNYLVTPHIGGRSLEDRIATDEFMIAKLITHLHNNQKD